jgi:hypothetical protein
MDFLLAKSLPTILIGCMISFAVNASPKTDYMIHCMGCHAMNGQGMPPEVPAFDSTLGDIVGKIGGRAYLIQVPGASQSHLNDERLADVLTWLLREFVGDELPSDFQDISTLEVNRFRPEILTNPDLARVNLLSQ